MNDILETKRGANEVELLKAQTEAGDLKLRREMFEYQKLMDSERAADRAH